MSMAHGEQHPGDKAPCHVAVVIPSYKVARHIDGVISKIPDVVSTIYVIDDACPEGSGKLVADRGTDPRIRVIHHDRNQGVGGAVLTGYRAALADGADIIVKIDGDGQMDPTLMAAFIEPILSGEADYAKGNRFFNLEEVRTMPRLRLFGNAVLSLMAKLSTGYWNLFDPTNGYTAIHADAARLLPFEKISRRYFFETDMLFRLNAIRAVVVDVPMAARYGDEVSGLKISSIAGEFFIKHIKNFLKRIFYNYYLRDLSLASIELPLGIFFLLFGTLFGGWHWLKSEFRMVLASSGTVMLAALPVLIGVQLILAFFGYDIASVPKRPLSASRRRFSSRRDARC